MPQNGEGIGYAGSQGENPRRLETGTDDIPRFTPREDTRCLMGLFQDVPQGQGLLFPFSFGKIIADYEHITRLPLSHSFFPTLSKRG